MSGLEVRFSTLLTADFARCPKMIVKIVITHLLKSLVLSLALIFPKIDKFHCFCNKTHHPLESVNFPLNALIKCTESHSGQLIAP